MIPAVPSDRPAKTGGDYWRHATDGATDLGEFDTYGQAVTAGDRWLRAHDRTPRQQPWIGGADS